MAVDGLLPRAAARLHPRYRTPTAALWFQTGVSLVLLTANRYDQLLSYVVFADWLFFGLTVGALFRLRRRPADAEARLVLMPGHPVTTAIFVATAAGIVINSFVAYPAQSLAGSAILGSAAAVYLVIFGTRRDSKATGLDVS
jgi:basic amino acid/polyamine antiporter, APA family